MLKELVRERLIAAADEIFGLFQSTVASYEEQLCRARDETERHRRQLEAVCKTRVVVRLQDVQQLLGRPGGLPPQLWAGGSRLEPKDTPCPQIKGENGEEAKRVDASKLPPLEIPPQLSPGGCQLEPKDTPCPQIKEEDGEEAQRVVASELPPLDTSVKMEAKAPERLPLYHRSPSKDGRGGPPPDVLLAPLSDSNAPKEPSRNNARCEGDDKAPECSEEETTQSKREISPTPQKPAGRSSRAHMTAQKAKRHFACSICRKAFTKRSDLIQHVKTHTGENTFRCSTCGKIFSRKSYLELHMRIHTEQPFLCPLCTKTFSLKERLKSHLRRHALKKRFTCSVCGKAFFNKTDMVKHTRTHTGERPFSCSVCAKTFSQKYCLTVHTRVHTGEKPYRCSLCGKAYTRKSDMVVHMRNHTGEKPFSCSICGEKFARWSNLISHTRTHESGE